jgi:hypothetical protein
MKTATRSLSLGLGNMTGHQWLALGMLVLLAIYFGIVAKHAAHAVGGSDSSGYARIARGLLQGHVRQTATEIEQLGLPANYAEWFAPLAYRAVRQDGVLTALQAPGYPVGFPLHLAVGAALGGWQHGPFHVSPLLGALSLLLIYLVGRQLGLPRAYAYACGVLLAANPTVLLFSFLPMSDVAAMFWGLVTVWAGLRARQAERWALWAGAAFGVGVLVRPTNALLLAPLMFCLPLRPKVWLRFALGGLPTAAIFYAYNLASSGHSLVSGYSASFVQHAFTFNGFFKRLGDYVYWLSITLTPLPLLGWLGIAAVRQVGWRDRALLVAWFGVVLLLYALYDLYPQWEDTRFLLPGYPGLILGALLTTRYLLEHGWGERRWLRWAAGVLLLAAPFGVAVRFDHTRELFRFGRSQILSADACRWADQKLPERALIISMEMSGVLKFYTQRQIMRWDGVTPEAWPVFYRQLQARGYEFYALLSELELKRAQERVPGRWRPLGYLKDISLWQLYPLDKPLPTVKYVSGFFGWEQVGERRWQWMGDEGVVQLQNTRQATRLRIEGDVPVETLARPNTIKLSFNGVVLDQVVVKKQSLQMEYLIPAAQQGNGEWSELRLAVDQFVVPNQINPNNSDQRHLGFVLRNLLWEEPLPAK